MKNSLLPLLIFCLSTFTAAEESQQTAPEGPHGGSVVSGKHNKFEVTIDPTQKSVHVYTLEAKKGAPKKMRITLFRERGSGNTIDLQSMNLKEALPQYQGKLSVANDSYVGVELRFETGLKKLEVLKFIPYMPTRK